MQTADKPEFKKRSLQFNYAPVLFATQCFLMTRCSKYHCPAVTNKRENSSWSGGLLAHQIACTMPP
jgi:hypothetical protein